MIKVEEHDAGVRVVVLENGPVNVLDLELLRELTATLSALRDAPASRTTSRPWQARRSACDAYLTS
jgi:enoyl-CoA hydratase/carnithine racemase